MITGEPIPVEKLRKHRDAFAWLQGQVASTFVDRPPLEEIPGIIRATEGFDERFDPEAPFLSTLIDQAIQYAVDARHKRGLSYP